jgi:hypothetical protein
MNQQPPQDKSLEEINRDVADDPMETRWFNSGDKMKAKLQPKREWEALL